MSFAAFGPGALYVTRTDIANQTPVNIGFAKSFEIDESGDLVENYGQNQYAIDAAVGTKKATGKMTAARISALAINSVFHGETLAMNTQIQMVMPPGEVETLPAATTMATTALANAGATSVTVAATNGLQVGQVVTNAALASGTSISALTGTTITFSNPILTGGIASGAILTFGPSYTVANGASFNQDLGVVYTLTGYPLMLATGAATAAGYYTYNGTTGTYFFHPLDGGKQLSHIYAFTSTTAGSATKTVYNHVIGYTPTFQIDYATVLNGQMLYVRVFKCICNKLTRKFAIKDFVAPELDYALMANPANQVYTDSYGTL